jgi:hypothetical protein
MTGSGVKRLVAGDRGAHRGIRWTVQAVVAASAVVALAACGGSLRAGGTGGSAVLAGSQTETDHVQLIGKIDADMGAPGTFTGMDGWPAMAPADIHVKAGAIVVVTIKEYDDMVTPVAGLSPYLKVMGGTEIVNGKRVTSVGNSKLAHTFTIPSLGINVPLPIAAMDGPMGSMGGPTTIRFTFRAPAPGTYQWLCVTPCGGDPDGVGGAMHTDGWMRGHLIVS